MMIIEENIPDAILPGPRQKYPAIFVRFDALAPGESLAIPNDLNPLFYQLSGERGDIFSWQYMEGGQKFWQVCIRKRLPGEGVETPGQITAKDLRKAKIFKSMVQGFIVVEGKSFPCYCR